MAQRWNIVKLVLRAAVWKSMPQPAPVGPLSLILAAAAAVAGGLVYEYALAGPGAQFSAYGLNAELAVLVLTLGATALFVRAEGRMTVLCAVMLLAAIMDLGCAVVVLAYNTIPFPRPTLRALYIIAAGGFLLQLIWWGGAVFTVLREFTPTPRAALLRTGGLWLTLVAVSLALPYQPTFRGRNFDMRSANLWEYIPALIERRQGHADAAPPRGLVNRARVELMQPGLIEAQVAHLTRQVPGKTDVYAIGIAGSSDFEVFPKELGGGLESLGRILPLDGHVLRLVNNADTVNAIPMASRQNFAAAVHAVAQVMDRNEDVLVLFMTSHGNEQGLALYLYGAFNVMLAPDDVAAVLDHEGIKNRVVVVSACYSGVFVKPLANDNTIVLTAADDKHTSFGCSNEREWTYFGDAFFNHALLPGGDIEEAFRDAKVAIGQWEARDGLEPSNPQGYFGRAVTAKLAPVYLKATTKQAMQSPAR